MDCLDFICVSNMTFKTSHIKGTVTIITGASGGIGAACAREFALAGGRVVLVARREEELKRIASEIGDLALAINADVASATDMVRVAETTLGAFGRIDTLINNAAVIEPIGHFADVTPEDFSRAVDINLKGVYNATHAVLPAMLKQGNGNVLLVSSGAAHRPVEGWSAYCASKAGAAMLTQTLDLEYRSKGIRALSLSPGTVATDMQRVIRKSGINPISQLDWSAHIPAEWPARVLQWMASAASDSYLGGEVSLRDEAIRRVIGAE